MSCYFVDIKEKAQLDLAKLKKDEPKLYSKALKLIGELYEHPSQVLANPSSSLATGQASGDEKSATSTGWYTRFTTLRLWCW